MTGVTTSTAFLKDVVAYVDVWSASRMEDYSDPFIEQLQDMGAQVSKTLNKQVTHVIFKHGRPSTWKKAQKIGVKVVSVHWVARCKETNQHVNEDLFPAQNEESKQHLLNKRTHCCMQPRDIPIKTPENDRRLKRKIDKMMESLVPSSPVVSDTSPFIIDEERGIVYSPSLKRSDSMAQRLKEMKAGREHLSPTASQKQDIGSEHDPSPPASTALSFLQQLEEEPLDPFSVSHCHALKKRGERQKLKCIKKSIVKISRKQVNHKPPESDACNRVSVEKNIENPLSSKSELGLLSKTGGAKQTTLKNFSHEACSKREESSNLKPETKNTGISTELYASSEKPKSFPPKSLTKTIRRKSAHNCKELLTNSKCLYSSKSSSENEHIIQKDESMIDKPMQKHQRRTSAGLHSASVCALPSREIADGELFEDFFSPANNASKRRVVLFDLTSDAMPTFDLEDSNKKGRRKSHKKQKLNIEDLPVASSDSVNTMEESVLDTRESRSERVAVVVGKENKSTTDGIERSSEMCSKVENMKKDKCLKKSRTLVMTSMPTEKQEVVFKVIRNLGGFTVVDDVCESTSHVVSGSPRRTVNILLGIARGCWILSFEWILWCLEHQQWVSEEPFELSEHFPAAPICRLQQHLSAGEYQQDLFHNQLPMFVSPYSQPPCGRLKELIKLCGGTVCRSVRQAGICIGGYNGKKPEGSCSLSEQWILDCVTHLILLPYKNYVLE